MVRVITVVAEETEGAVKGPGTAEATEIVAAKTAVPAQVMGIAAVIRAAEMPEEVEDEVAETVVVAVRATEPPEDMPKAVVRAVEVAAAKAVEAPEVVAVGRVLGAVAAVAKATAEMPAVAARGMGEPGVAPAKAMEAEAALVPKAPEALEAQAIRPATTAAANLGEHRLQHPRP